MYFLQKNKNPPLRPNIAVESEPRRRSLTDHRGMDPRYFRKESFLYHQLKPASIKDLGNAKRIFMIPNNEEPLKIFQPP
ncbi:MAG: hypothetical protein CBC46_05520 [Verrucomicrobiaceae bacterium TMED86]|nr:MAG: hypothetical protein CBC46_05520 [Verrucomicrobiaceae bacterium TMED86]